VTKGVDNLETQILYLKGIGEMTESLDSSVDYAGGRGCSWLCINLQPVYSIFIYYQLRKEYQIEICIVKLIM